MSNSLPAAKPITILYIVVGCLIGLPLLLILFQLLPLLIDPARAVESKLVAGSVAQAEQARILLLGFAGFGLLSLVYGLYRLVTGKRSAVLKYAMFACGVVGLYGMYRFGTLL